MKDNELNNLSEEKLEFYADDVQNDESDIETHHGELIHTSNSIDDSTNTLLHNSIDSEVRAANIELNLNVVIGEIRLTIKDLLNFKPGDKFTIGELPPKVKLLINSTYIGQGVLVEFNGNLGVKIISMVNKI